MKAQVISFHCVLKNKFGRIISSTINRDIMTQSDGSGMLIGLAEGLRDLQSGEKRSISLRADEAYGFYDPKMAIIRSREDLPGSEQLRVGDQVVIPVPETGKKSQFRVVGIAGESISLDANHPLAGQDLVFEIEAIEAREATSEEVQEANEPEIDERKPLLH